MIETDCPYMSPEPVRNQRPNEPALMVHTARYMADLLELEYKTFCAGVTETSRHFFHIEPEWNKQNARNCVL